MLNLEYVRSRQELAAAWADSSSKALGSLRLMCVFAHPDDEALGNGGMLARYAAEGVETHIVTATRGERGWSGPLDDYPGPEVLGRQREAEERAAAAVLGVKDVTFLGYRDGELADADPAEVIAAIGSEIQRVKPDVVVTFDQNGLYGHPDHVTISRLTTAAVVSAGTVDFGSGSEAPTHLVPKLYYMAWTEPTIRLYESVFGSLAMDIDGETRQPVAWPAWAVTTRLDASEGWQRAWEAISCHRSQLPGYDGLLKLPESFHRRWWSGMTYYRAFSLVETPPGLEDDLFAGLRPD